LASHPVYPRLPFESDVLTGRLHPV
jgi:hypothetical protein